MVLYFPVGRPMCRTVANRGSDFGNYLFPAGLSWRGWNPGTRRNLPGTDMMCVPGNGQLIQIFIKIRLEFIFQICHQVDGLLFRRWLDDMMGIGCQNNGPYMLASCATFKI